MYMGGPDCSNAHVWFDLGNVRWQEEHDSNFHVMSVDFENESLEDAIWFVLFSAMVDDEIGDECSVVVASVRDKKWASVIEEDLSNISAFNERMTNV